MRKKLQKEDKKKRGKKGGGIFETGGKWQYRIVISLAKSSSKPLTQNRLGE
jgi:hypothetical protein